MADITSNLVVYYNFDNGYLNFANGSPGVADTSNNGTTISNTIYKVGGGSLSSNIGGYLKMNNITTSTSFYGTNGISFSLWLNYTDSSGATPRVFDIGKLNGAFHNTRIELTNNATSLTANCFPNSQTFSSPISSTGDYKGKGWNHFAWTMTYSAASTSTWVLYVNGVVSGTYNNLMYPDSTYIGASYFFRSNTLTPLVDGAVVGYIDEFRIYQRVLSATDVAALYSYPTPPQPPSPCFREGTQILCFEDNEEVYIPVEKLRTGTLVKTVKNSYVPVHLIGTKKLYNPSHTLRVPDRLYVCRTEKYPQLSEDLYLTGNHSILIKDFTEEQRRRTTEALNDIFITDGHYRLLTYLDDRSEPYEVEGMYNIYHFALENAEERWNYGVYANGLLVETCSKRYIKEYAGMQFLE
jgi:hypothetical protein